MDNYYTHYQICLRSIKNNITSIYMQKYHVRKCTISKKTDIIVHIENYVFDKIKLNRLLSIIDEKSYCFINSDKFSNYNLPHTYTDILKLQFIDIPKPNNTDNFNIYLTYVPSMESFNFDCDNMFLKKYEILSSSI